MSTNRRSVASGVVVFRVVARTDQRVMERRAFRAGETIFREGDPSDCAFLIVVGLVNVHLSEGRLKQLGPGEIFGEMGLFDSRPRSATVIAAEYSVFAAYSEAELLGSIRNNPDEAIAFIRALIGRLREANDILRQSGRGWLLPNG